MRLSTGTRLGPYEIQELLGAGGMGEVYRATDIRLNRKVAVKILPKHLSADHDAHQRFEREARTISNLSDPHICALYDIGQHGEIHYLVMEYLQGETLAERLTKGRLPMPLVKQYGIEICEGLQKAHEKGIIHRDLKPANIMLTASSVKLLDFGLARWLDSSSPSGLDASEIATVDRPPSLTEQGTIAGTIPYMSPEQLEGKRVDHRTDIFAAGAVLYEMASGQRAFSAGSKAGLISAILSSEPPAVTETRSDFPPAFDYVLARCLAKEPNNRWQSAQDVAIALKGITDRPAQRTETEKHLPVMRKRELIAWIVAFLLFSAALFFAIERTPDKSSNENVELTTLSVLPPETSFVTSLALSPDGRRIVYAALNRAGQSSLWVRSLDSLFNSRLSGTEDASYPFWSADAKSIGFFANGKLKTVAVSGGPIQTLWDAPNARGGTWNAEGTILFSLPRYGIYRIRATGGEAVPEISAAYDRGHRWPHFLPDGQHYFYTVGSVMKAEEPGVYLAALGSREKRKILSGLLTRVEYAAPGYLVFTNKKSLMARPFDAKKLETQGEPFLLVDEMRFEGTTGYVPFSVANNGILAISNVDLKSQLTWFDRSGRRLGDLGEAAGYMAPSLSADRKKLLVSRADTATQLYDLWMFDLSNGRSSRFTFNPAKNEIPGIWSTDDKNIIFSTNSLGWVNLYQKPASGMGEEKLLLQTDSVKTVTDMSKDGRHLLFENAPQAELDLWILPLAPRGQPQAFLETESREKQGQFSPDGKWIAYSSDETGKNEIYVRSFPASAGGKWQVSVDGGEQPRWRSDGKELYYIASDRKLMAVPIQFSETFEADSPIPLFETRLPPVPLAGGFIQYAVAADGQRFLINTLLETAPSAIHVLLNWPRLRQ